MQQTYFKLNDLLFKLNFKFTQFAFGFYESQIREIFNTVFELFTKLFLEVATALEKLDFLGLAKVLLNFVDELDFYLKLLEKKLSLTSENPFYAGSKEILFQLRNQLILWEQLAQSNYTF